MRVVKLFLSALLAGVCIGLGGTVFLSLDNKVLGALFFTVGLFTICTMGMHLFTGKVCYVFEKDAAMRWISFLSGWGIWPERVCWPWQSAAPESPLRL